MTPELKTACEVIFQEHKVSTQPIKWNSETFRGRISLGLSDLAKETLVKKNIIILPNRAKKVITQLNPAVATALTFEEAEVIIMNKGRVATVSATDTQKTFVPNRVKDDDTPPQKKVHRLLPLAESVELPSVQIKWYMKPMFYYIVWPLCAVVAGALISFLLDFIFSALFLG